MKQDFWCGKRVFVTGHTGFKGGWLALWLASMGAQVHGYALEPPTTPALFKICDIKTSLASNTMADIRNGEALTAAMQAAQPEIVFHLAAQSLVRHSYDQPVATYAVNVMGTVNLLEAVRDCSSVKAVVNVTTDKCYENREWFWSYRENEAMGGHDPYSSSKGCAELVTAAYRSSFFASSGVGVATARAGNVIGGGDWASDRLLPDFLRAIDAGEIMLIRSPQAMRPWQHVLEPLSGYIVLAERLYQNPHTYAEAWNFGPRDDDARNVLWLVKHLSGLHPEFKWECCSDLIQPHEANYLKLDSSKARMLLGWTPRWNLETALGKVLEWHDVWRRGGDMRAMILMQIKEYQSVGIGA